VSVNQATDDAVANVAAANVLNRVIRHAAKTFLANKGDGAQRMNQRAKHRHHMGGFASLR
jgi:hypothetical protein